MNESVSVLYDQKSPEKFVIGTDRNFNYFSLILIILVGVVTLIVGTLSLLEIIQIDF